MVVDILKIDTIGNLNKFYGKKISSVLIIGLVLGICLFGVGCAEKTENEAKGEVSEFEEEITIGYVLWETEIASTNVIQQVLQQAGYENVEIMHVDAGPLYQGLASSNFDFTVSAWLPKTQVHYWNLYEDKVDSVGTNLENCPIGFVVPAQMEEINSIGDLNANKDKFDGKIIGIDPGSGTMDMAETAVEEYGLDMELIASSNAAMIASLKKAMDAGEPIVVTLWHPHWAFNRWELKLLKDPKGVFCEADHVETLARKGLQADMPNLYGILERFHWTHEDIQSVMVDIENGMEPEEAAAKWIENNPEKVREWIGEE